MSPTAAMHTRSSAIVAAGDLHEIRLADDPAAADLEAQRGRNKRLGSPPPCFAAGRSYPRLRETCFVAFAACAAASFLVLQRTAVVTAWAVRQDLRLGAAEMAWTNMSSGLAAAVLLLPLASLLPGRTRLSERTALLASLAVFALATGLVATARSGLCFALLSALAGAACAAHVFATASVVSAAYATYPSPDGAGSSSSLGCSPRRRALVFALFLGGGNAIGALVGCLGSGLVATRLGWRAAYIFVGVYFMLVALLGVWAVPNVGRRGSVASDGSDPAEGEKPGTGRRPYAFPPPPFGPDCSGGRILVNWVSAGLLAAGVTCVTVALTLGPSSSHGWAAPKIIVLLVLGGLALLLLVASETRSKNPLVSSLLWKGRNRVVVVLFMLSSALGYSTTLFWIVIFLQAVRGSSPFLVALELLPQATVSLLIGPTTGFLFRRVHNTAVMAVAACCQAGAGLLLVFLAERDGGYFAYFLPALILSMVSMDLALSVSSEYIVSATPANTHCASAAVLQAVVRLAVPIGLGATTAIWSSFTGDTADGTAMLPFSKIFIAIAAFAGLSLVLVPLANLGKLGPPRPGASGDSAATMGLGPGESQHRLPYSDSIDRAPSSASASSVGKDPVLVREASSSLKAGARTTIPGAGPWRPAPIGPRSSSLFFSNAAQRPGGGGTAPPFQARAGGGITTRGHPNHFPAPSTSSSSYSGTASTSSSSGAAGVGRSGSQRTGSGGPAASRAERVIWLVCEDCGSSKRMVEPVGDPERYFYDNDAGVVRGRDKDIDVAVRMGIADSGVLGGRRFPLVARA